MKPWTKWKGNLWNETIFETHISDKQLISKLYKELLQLSRLKKKQAIQLKMGKGSE